MSVIFLRDLIDLMLCEDLSSASIVSNSQGKAIALNYKNGCVRKKLKVKCSHKKKEKMNVCEFPRDEFLFFLLRIRFYCLSLQNKITHDVMACIFAISSHSLSLFFTTILRTFHRHISMLTHKILKLKRK